jgi:hypothetical protein
LGSGVEINGPTRSRQGLALQVSRSRRGGSAPPLHRCATRTPRLRGDKVMIRRSPSGSFVPHGGVGKIHPHCSCATKVRGFSGRRMQAGRVPRATLPRVLRRIRPRLPRRPPELRERGAPTARPGGNGPAS